MALLTAVGMVNMAVIQRSLLSSRISALYKQLNEYTAQSLMAGGLINGGAGGGFPALSPEFVKKQSDITLEIEALKSQLVMAEQILQQGQADTKTAIKSFFATPGGSGSATV